MWLIETKLGVPNYCVNEMGGGSLLLRSCLLVQRFALYHTVWYWC